METFFSKNGSLEFIPCDFIKNELHRRDYLAWVLQGTFFNILENFLRGISYFFYQGNYDSAERTRASQLGLDKYNCVTGNVYIWMPMPMLLPMSRWRCRDFQMPCYQFNGDHLLCRTFKCLLLNLQRLDRLWLHEFFYDFHRG